MEKFIFIADFETKYGQKINDVFLSASYKIIKTVKTKKINLENITDEIEWNNYSAFSHKNIIFNLRKYQVIQNIFIIFSLPEPKTLLHKSAIADFNKEIDLYLKSQVAITCEIINEFSASQTPPYIFLILPAGNANPYREFFKFFINGILEDNTIPSPVNAFEIGKELPETFADFVLTTVQDKAIKARGKWFKYMRYALF
jgi:hypothetical protein